MGKLLILTENVKIDPLGGEIGKAIKKLNRRKSWNSEVEQQRRDLINLLRRHKYIYFLTHPYAYNLTTVGASYLYQVPHNRRGHLKCFRGQCIRMVAVHSGRFEVGVMAGPE